MIRRVRGGRRIDLGGHTCVYRVKEVCALLLLLDVCVDQEGVCLGMDVLHHDLEAVEAARFRDLDLAAESLDEVLVDDTIGGGEEGEHVRDEVPLIIIQAVVPVVQIFGEVDFLSCPEGGFGFLVHLPYLG